MYARYATTAVWTMADVISDIGKICTGAALNTLSASCNQELTAIVSNTAPAGWTMHDAATGQLTFGGGIVLTALERNNVTPKYLNIFASTANTISFSATQAWNATTHVATNASAPTPVANYPTTMQVNQGQALLLNIFVTREYIFLMQGGSSTLSIGVISGEILRDSEFISNNVSPLYPTHFVGNANISITADGGVALPIMKNPIGAGTRVTTQANMTWMSIGRLYTSGSSSSRPNARQYFKSDSNTFYPVAPLFLGDDDSSNIVFYGRMADSGGYAPLVCSSSIGADGDIMVVNGNDYMLFNTPGLLIPVR